MNTMRLEWQGNSQTCWPDDEVAELSVLLPGPQAAALEKLANARGQTLGQYLRLLIQNHLTGKSDSGASSGQMFPKAGRKKPEGG